MDGIRRKYLLVCATDWLLLSIIGVLAVRWLEVPWWIPSAIVVVWIVKDLMSFPARRRYYEPQPAETRLVGQVAEALSSIDPDGFVRIHGEIWQAHLAPNARAAARGHSVRVCRTEGLHLFVEPVVRAPMASS